MKSVLFCTLFLLTLFAEARFSKGDRFQYVSIDGSLTIQCRNRTKTVTCKDVFLDPWPYDVIIGPRNSRASSIEVRATVGSEFQTTSADYDGSTGRSAELNLGIYSLFQKPLLKVGENKVRYSILDRDRVVLISDSFDVTVTRGRGRSCEARETTSNNPQDCDHPYTLCQLYFRNQNYCK